MSQGLEWGNAMSPDGLEMGSTGHQVQTGKVQEWKKTEEGRAERSLNHRGLCP